MTTKQQCCR